MTTITIRITNNGSSGYVIDNVVNPSISFIRENTYNLSINTSGHPFQIRNGNIPLGVTDGVTNNGTDNGTITYVVPFNAPNTLSYVCTNHPSMTGTINIISRPFELEWLMPLITNSINDTHASVKGVAIDSNNNVYITGYAIGGLYGGRSDAFLAKYDSSGIIQWARQFATFYDDGAYGVAIDSNNNVYITGSTRAGVVGMRPYDAFLEKYDSSGIKQWTKLLGTSSYDEAYGVAIDSNNNVYITGFTYGSLLMGPYNAFLAKYDSSGIKQWTTPLGTSNSNDTGANGVAIDSNNNVYITGSTNGSLDGITSAGLYDAFLAKYDSSGIKQWTKLLGTSSDDIASGIAIDSNNNVYITGYTAGSLDGITSAGLNDAFLAKYDSSGIKQWTRQLGTSYNNEAYGVAIDSNNNVYITGITYIMNVDGESSAFLAKYVAPRPITVPTLSWFSIQKTVGDADFQITAPTSNSNGVFTYSSSDTSVATINGTTVTIINAGRSTITASQAETLNYNAGTIPATLQVNPAPQQSQTPTIFSNISMRSLFTNNAQVFYKPHSLSTGSGGSGVRNSRHKQRRT
jgi:hypothetical protein